MHIHLDPIGGIAGDMFLAAMLDAFPQHEAGTLAAMRAAGLPETVRVALEAGSDHHLTGHRLRVKADAERMPAPAGRVRDLRALIDAAPLADAVRARAIAILELLAEAEAGVHGIAADDVHFHELAGWDSIADLVGAAFVIEAVGARSWSVAPLPIGGGRIASAHGPLPVPAPATARLLDGFAMVDDGIGGERVTPTGAAILRHLRAQARAPRAAMTLGASGTGFGTRRMPGIANALRVLAFDVVDRRTETPWRIGEVVQIAFEVDDQSPEDLAIGLDRLRQESGVLDLVQSAVTAKKGRLATRVELLCRPEERDGVIAACFRETTTIGLRHQTLARAELVRTATEVADEAGVLRVKQVARPDGPDAKVEADDLGAIGGAAARKAARRRGESVLPRADDPGS